MPRGVAHPPELKAQAVAAVLAGAALAAVARQYGISKGTLGTWLATHEDRTVRTPNARARDPETLEALIFDLVAEHLTTLRTQLQATARADWLAQQSAADLAQLLGTERDTLLRLLAGFRPVDNDRARLPEPAAPPPGADADDE